MEPFAPAYGLFPEVPDQAFFLQSAPPAVVEVLQAQALNRLRNAKRLLSTQSITDPRLFRFERAVARLGNRVGRWLPTRVERRIAHFTLLNLNRFEDSYPIFPKTKTPSHWVIKELRFAGKVPLLRDAFPDARFLVVLRSPHATVHSMLRWFSRGGLGEVRRELNSFVEKLECQRIASAYAPQIEVARAVDLAHRAALYWRVCYEQMEHTLQRVEAPYRILPYEAIARHPNAEAKALLDWAGIPWHSYTASYLDYSTAHDVHCPTATNTIRRSDTYSTAWIAEISDDVRQAVDEIVLDSPLLRHLRQYYQVPSNRS
jgi:hypothetical protein